MKFVSLYLTFKDDDIKLNPKTNEKSNTTDNINNIKFIFDKSKPIRKATRIIKIIDNNICIKFNKTIEIIIVSLGKIAFLIKNLSEIIEGVALVTLDEKKFHTNKPENK